jgi:hypothetical protein
LLPALITACAGTVEIPADTQAVRDYVEVGELQEVDRLRSHVNDGWSALTDYYVLYGSRDGQYLLEFNRICHALTDSTRVTPDYRYDNYAIRSRFDTLRGCRIDAMYQLTEAQAMEIEALVKSAAGGN